MLGQSSLFYLSTIFFSTFFAWLANYFSVIENNGKKLNWIFWSISFLSLWFTMGFRLEIGVDYGSYKDIFDQINAYGFFGFYQTGNVLEPLYVFLLYLVSIFSGKFIGVFICTSFIGLFFIYKAFAFEARAMNPAWYVFVFSTTQYFYYFGIDRLFLAVAVSVYGYRFLVAGKNRKYYFTVVIASLFHFSALLLCVLPYVIRQIDKRAHEFRFIGIKKILLFVSILLFVIWLFPQVKPYLAERYHGYGTIEEPLSVLSSVAMKLPIVALIIYARIIRPNIFSSSMVCYANIYIASILIQLFIGMLGLGRYGWYFWFPLCFLLPLLMRSQKYLLGKSVMFAFVVSFCISYMFYAYLGTNSSRYPVMFPYRNIFFDLK